MEIKKIIINSLDAINAIAWISFSIPLLGWLFGAESDWRTITFGEFFDKKIWFNIWIISIFYIAVRLLLREKLWDIVFENKKNKEIIDSLLPYLIGIGVLIAVFYFFKKN